MGIAGEPSPVKLCIGMLTRDESLFDEVASHLRNLYGATDFVSHVIPFTFTSYYEKEMGSSLLRRFFSFRELIDQGSLSLIKIATNELEAQYSKDGEEGKKRRINLDPGYIGLSKLVLATVKDRSHRIFIGNGIYAEITLQYEKKTFNPWHWTYPDYRTPEYIEVFNTVRDMYVCQLKEFENRGVS